LNAILFSVKYPSSHTIHNKFTTKYVCFKDGTSDVKFTSFTARVTFHYIFCCTKDNCNVGHSASLNLLAQTQTCFECSFIKIMLRSSLTSNMVAHVCYRHERIHFLHIVPHYFRKTPLIALHSFGPVCAVNLAMLLLSCISL
jgi:hypothetical protein